MSAARPAAIPVRASEKVDHSEIASLTGRELEILRHIYDGEGSQATADALFISKRTVDFHLANIYRKWNIRSRKQAVSIAIRHGLLTALPQTA